MNRLLVLLLLLWLFSTQVHAQRKHRDTTTRPAYCLDGDSLYIDDVTRCFKRLYGREHLVPGQTTVRFVIDEYGYTSEVKLLGDYPPFKEKEIDEIIRRANWRPALYKGKEVKSVYEFKINY